MLSSLTWKTSAQKKHKEAKKACFRLKALFLLKNMFSFYFSSIAKLIFLKKLILKFSFFEVTPIP